MANSINITDYRKIKNNKGFLNFLKLIIDNSYNDIESYVKKELGIKQIPSRSNEDIISGGLCTTPMELLKKQGDENYYFCNAVCFIKVFKEIFSKEKYKLLKSKMTPPFIVSRYYFIFRTLMVDFDMLIQLYQLEITKKRENLDIYIRRDIQCMPLHQTLRQALYGSISFDSFSDIELYPSIGIIRQLIELRIRRAFGVLAYLDKNGNNIPLNFSKLMESISKHKKNINLPIKFENINRIYRWSNMYIHYGEGDFCWLFFFIEKYLRPLTFGADKGKSYSINNGISMSQSIINVVKNELLENAKVNEKVYTLQECNPECEILD